MPLFTAGELETDLGPHSYIDNPNPNAAPDQKRVPTKIRAALKLMSGDVFEEDWNVDLSKDICKSPVKLPSHHPNFEIVRSYLQDTNLPMSDRITAVLKDRNVRFNKVDLLNHLYSQGYITLANWKLARKLGSEADSLLKRFAAHPERFKPTPPPTPPLPELKAAPPSIEQQTADMVMPALQEVAYQERDELAEICDAVLMEKALGTSKPLMDDLITQHKDEEGRAVYNEARKQPSSGITETLKTIGGVLAVGIDQLTPTGPTVKVEGLQAEPETLKAEAEPKSEADQSDDLAAAALSIVAPNSETLHTIEMIEHAIDAIELLHPKQAPAPIVRHETPPAATSSLTGTPHHIEKLTAIRKKMQRRL